MLFPRSRPVTQWLFLGLLGGAALGVCATRSQAGEPPGGKKLQRQIHVFERVMDEMLIDSPNWLVSGRDDTRGYYIPGFGTLFSFDAALVSHDWARGLQGLKILPRGSWRLWYGDEDDDEDDDGDRDSRKSERSRLRDRDERRYERGKDEIRDVLLDFGDSLEAMKSGEWVTVVVYLRDDGVFRDKDISNLVMKIRIDDLRAYGDGKLSDERTVAKIVEEEY